MFLHRISDFIGMLIAALITSSAYASYEGDFSLYSYSELFYEPGSYSNSYGVTKEIYTERSDLSLSSNGTYSIALNEATIKRSVFEFRTFDEENLIYNSYTNFLAQGQSSEGNAYTSGPYDTVVVQTGDGTAKIFFSSNTNVALVAMTDEESADYEEVGLGIAVRKSSGLSNAVMNGTFIRFGIGNHFSGQTEHGSGNIDSLLLEQSIMQFDGLGNFTEQVDEWASRRVITENVITNGSDHYINSYCTVAAPETDSFSTTNGSYAVNASNGIITLTFPDVSMPAQVSPDGNLIATALAEADGDSAGSYFNIAIKQPASMPTNAIDAVFFALEMDEEFDWNIPSSGNCHNAIEVGRSYIYFNSDNTFSMRSDYWNIGNVLENQYVYEEPHGILSYNQFTTQSQPRSIELSGGTYSIATNGLVTLLFDHGDMGIAQVSENGKYVVYGFADGGEGYGERWMGFGIRRDEIPADTEPITFNSDFEMTPTGVVFSASVPTNVNVEILCTANLSEGEWNSLVITNSVDGNLQIKDSGASSKETRFYNATFGIW